MIEEASDGFLILNPDRQIVFFNEVFLRMMGLRSIEIFEREKEFISALRLGTEAGGHRDVRIPDREGTLHPFTLDTFTIEGETKAYLLLRFNHLHREHQERYQARGNLESLFSHLGDPVFICDLNGAIHSANGALFKLLGVPAESGVLDIRAFYANPEELEDKVLRLVQDGSFYNLETHLYTTNRELRRVLDTSWVIRNERGIVTGYSTHFRDVTYLKNLEERLQISERNYLMLMESILSPLTIVDPLGRILNWNYSAEQFYGYPWEDVVGRDFDDIARPSMERPPLREILQRVDENNGRYVETDIPRRCRDGTIKFTYSSYSALTDSEKRVVAYSIIEKDLTERIRLERKLKDSFKRLKQTQSAAILGFARLTEYRDKSTGKHLERIREYTRIMATALRKLPKYRDYITEEYIDDLCLSSVLHDVGKVGIEDSILFKPGRLEPEEYERIKDHTRFGGDALSEVDRSLVRQSFLTMGKEIAYYHHERWDGTGYPKGLQGDAIPLSARIVALADVYDALTSHRIYKEALPHEEAVEIIQSERGTHFDPDIVDAFLTNHEIFRRINIFIALQEHPSSIDDLLAGKKREKQVEPATGAEAAGPATVGSPTVAADAPSIARDENAGSPAQEARPG
jgi:PAS domain S-box-containing protein